MNGRLKFEGRPSFPSGERAAPVLPSGTPLPSSPAAERIRAGEFPTGTPWLLPGTRPRAAPSPKQEGWTLIELVVTLGLSVLLVGIALGTLRIGQQAWGVGSTQATLSMELRRGLQAMSRELEQVSPAQLTLSGGPDSDGWYTQAEFRIPQDDGVAEDEDIPPDPDDEPTKYTHRTVNGRRVPETIYRFGTGPVSPEIEWSPQILYRFDADDEQLVREEDGSERPLAGHVERLRFRPQPAEPPGTERLEVELTVSGENRHWSGGAPRTVTRTVETEVRLRNE